MAAKLAGANIILVVFNMIPAFPMDGGRVLRALLAMRMGNARATEVAATIGQGFAVVFGILGIFYNPMLIIIAVFIFLAASGEAAQAQLRAVAQGTLVSDAMITEFQSLGTNATVNDAADALIRTTQTEFPIVDGSGKLRGVLTRDAMIKALKERGRDAGARRHADRCPDRAGARQARYGITLSDAEGASGGRRYRRARPPDRPAYRGESRRDDDDPVGAAGNPARPVGQHARMTVCVLGGCPRSAHVQRRGPAC
jgi:hypothetical protein